MKQALFALFLLCAFYLNDVFASVQVIHFARFGEVKLYSSGTAQSRVILFLSGGEARRSVVADLEMKLAGADVVVAGIDAARYVSELQRSREKCHYPAADLEALSKEIEKKLNFAHYVLPVVIGHSEGASLAYASLAQAPPNTFYGLITVGFCPENGIGGHYCSGTGLQVKPAADRKRFTFLPSQHLETPWLLLADTAKPACSASSIAAFTKGIAAARVIPTVNEANENALLTQLESALDHLNKRNASSQSPQSAPSEKPKDLPLIELPASGKASDSIAFILTGDGGWASLDREVGTYLATQGIAVVGFDCLQYFWTRRTPDEAAKDFSKVMQYYLTAWHKRQALLIGYSFGADVLPFLAHRLPADLLRRVRLIGLLGPSRDADFEFHVTEWLGSGRRKDSQPVLPEVKKLKGTRILCFYGRDDADDSLCTLLDASLATRVPIEGGHHFGGDYQTIAKTIVTESQ
jgi:type IV secretory pathway VirJ component